jgi:hypothetical protein
MTVFCSTPELRHELVPLIRQYFSVSPVIAVQLFDSYVNVHFSRLKKNIHFVIEYPYVDRVYRDSYYRYFSTKTTSYNRNCIRLSLFDNEISPDLFRGNKVTKMLQHHYLGYLVLRPTIPQIIGRNMISPKALSNSEFHCLTTFTEATTYGVKLIAEGFPHSSQDTETISCAETSVWSIMEYFSSRYPDYRPVLPSVIIEVLRDRFNVRQLPSGGLNMEQMAYAFRQFGFGPKIYAAQQYTSSGLSRLISCYLESGIPILVALDNNSPTSRIGHSTVMIGHSKVTDDAIDNLAPSTGETTLINNLARKRGITIFDNDDIDKEYIIIDDNYPAYQKARFSDPTHYYHSKNWRTCKIVQFVAPLHTKIYLEAFNAKDHIKMIFLNAGFQLPQGTAVFFRIFLASSRSYKDYLAQVAGISNDARDFILEVPMPKFIWVGEISNKSLIKQKLAKGLIILAATEPDVSNYKALLFAGYNDQVFYASPDTKELKQIPLSLGTFTLYYNNLKCF